MPSPTTLRRPVVSALRVGVLAAGALAACAGAVLAVGASRDASKPSEPKSAPVSSGAIDLGVAQVLDFDITTIASGELKAKNQIELRNRLEFEAAIVEIVPEGTRVKKGDLVIRLNADQIQQQIDEQLIQLEQAKNEVTGAENALAIQQNENAAGERKAVLAVELAQLEFDKWLQGEVESKRQQLAVALDEARSELDRLQTKASRSKRLNEQGFISLDELQRDELAARKQKAALETAELNSRVYESFEFPRDRKQKQSALDEAKSELDRIRQKNASELASKQSHRTATRQQLGLRETRLAKLKEQLDMATMTAPADGLVVYGSTIERRNWGGDQGPFQIGRKVWPNQLLIGLPDTSKMTGVVKVHESIAGRIKPEQTAMVRIDAIGGKSVAGKVFSIGLLAEGENWLDPNMREFRVTIDLSDEAKALEIRPSMRCEATILMDNAKATLCVPIQGVMSEGAIKYVLVPSGSQYEKRAVKVGRRSDRYAEILAGIKEGEKVLLRTPESRELLAKAWSDAELAGVGLKRNDKGEVIAEAAPDPVQAPKTQAPSAKEPTPAAQSSGTPHKAG
jgi:HlyD family secretion protein